jgi:ribose 5-phosphate isomerase B
LTLVFASDHAGFEFRQALARYAESLGHNVLEVGAASSEPYDYPDAADDGVRAIQSGIAEFGVFICGTGIGISIRGNRHDGIRAALCCTPEMAHLAREHNDANVLCLGARTTEIGVARVILNEFLSGSASTEPRHVRRVDKLDADV